MGIGIILKPFAWLLLLLYNFMHSYGLALIVFAIIVKTILFPTTLLGKKSMIKTNMISGKVQQLQKQYGKDRERYNKEVQELYSKEKVNPMGGCLWSLIPMVVLIALYAVIRQPITYFMDLTATQIAAIADKLDWQTVAVANGWVSQSSMNKLITKLADGEITSVYQNGSYNQLYLLSLINGDNVAALRDLVGSHKVFDMDFGFLGVDLSKVPTLKFWKNGFSWASIGLFLIPLVSTFTSFISMKVSMYTNRMNNKAQQKNPQTDKTNKVMLFTMPLMSLWIGFTVPAGLSIYWIAQYLVTMVQEVICGRMLRKDYEKARLEAERRAIEEKEAEKRMKEEARLVRQQRIEEAKKNKGKNKAAAQANKSKTNVTINKEDSREGLRNYARGRAYVPNRYGSVTDYQDPEKLLDNQKEAAAASHEKRSKRKKMEKEQAAAAAEKEKEQQSAAPVSDVKPDAGEETVTNSPANPAEGPQIPDAPAEEAKQAEESLPADGENKEDT